MWPLPPGKEGGGNVAFAIWLFLRMGSRKEGGGNVAFAIWLFLRMGSRKEGGGNVAFAIWLFLCMGSKHLPLVQVSSIVFSLVFSLMCVRISLAPSFSAGNEFCVSMRSHLWE